MTSGTKVTSGIVEKADMVQGTHLAATSWEPICAWSTRVTRCRARLVAVESRSTILALGATFVVNELALAALGAIG